MTPNEVILYATLNIVFSLQVVSASLTSNSQVFLKRNCGRCTTSENLWTKGGLVKEKPLGISSATIFFNNIQQHFLVECCSGDNPHWKNQVLRVVAYGVVPYLRFDFSSGLFPKITGLFKVSGTSKMYKLFFSRIDVDIVNVLSEKLAFRYYAKNQKKHPQKILYALEHLSCQ